MASTNQDRVQTIRESAQQREDSNPLASRGTNVDRVAAIEASRKARLAGELSVGHRSVPAHERVAAKRTHTRVGTAEVNIAATAKAAVDAWPAMTAPPEYGAPLYLPGDSFPWAKVEFGCVILGENAKIYGGFVNLHGPDGGRYEYAPSGGFESFSPTDGQVAYARWTFSTNVVDVLVGSYPGADTDAIAYFKLYTFAKTGTALSISKYHRGAGGSIEVTPRQMA